MFLPLGFTPISFNYLPILPEPSLNNLNNPVETYSLSNYTFTSPNLNNAKLYIDQLNPVAQFKLDYVFDYVSFKTFPIIRFLVEVKDINNFLPLEGVPLKLFVLTSNFDLVNIPTAPISLTNRQGVAIFNLNLNFTTKFQTELTFFVLPILNLDNSNLFYNLLPQDSNETINSLNISNQTLTDLNISNLSNYSKLINKSNTVTILTDKVNGITSKSNQYEEIKLQDTSLEIQTSLINDYINQVYSNLVVSTNGVNPTQQATEFCAQSTVEYGFRLVQGFTKNELCRYSGWGTKVLFDVHSHLSTNLNSEVNIVDRTLKTSPVNFSANSKQSLDRYKRVLENTGQHIIATSQTYLSSQNPQGNNVETSYIHQIHAQHIRFNAGANFDVHSGGKLSLVGNQIFTNARWVNISSDTYQQISQHIWIRSENLLHLNSKDTVLYNTSSYHNYSANQLVATGQNVQYSDVLWNQVGQPNKPPFHASRSLDINHTYNTNPNSKVPYGTIVNLSMQDTHTVSMYGHLRFRANQHIKFLSDAGGFYFKSITGKYKVDTSSTDIKSLKHTLIQSAGRISLNSPLVCINCSNLPFDDSFDIISNVKDVTTLANKTSILQGKVDEFGKVYNSSKEVIGKVGLPNISSTGEVIHTIYNKLGQPVAEIVGALGQPTSVIREILTNRPAIRQADVSKKEALDYMEYELYNPINFNGIEDVATTIKTTSGPTTGPSVKVGSSLDNPGSVSPSGPSGVGQGI